MSVVTRLAWLTDRSIARSRCWVIRLLVGVLLIAGGPAHAADASSPARRAAYQLVGVQMPSGQFAFEHDFIPGRQQRLGTNSIPGRLAYVTRQAAAAYGLSNYFLHDHDAVVARALVAVLRNLEKLSLPIDKASGQAALESVGLLALPFGRYKLHNTLQWLGLLYRPNGEGRLVTHDRSYETAWGGATALSLLAELQFYQASHDPQFTQLRQAWLKGLLVLYDARGFRELPGSIDENSMSNAQVWLALAVYIHLFADDRATATTAAQVDEYMMRTYTSRFNANFYAWGINAAAQRLRTTSDIKFLRFITEQTRTYLEGVDPHPTSVENSCAEVEGLGTALHVLEAAANPDHALIRRLRQRVATEMTKNLSLQIQPGQTRIEFSNDTYFSSPSVAGYAGAFLAGRYDPYVRIDYTEHCMSALLTLSETNQ